MTGDVMHRAIIFETFVSFKAVWAGELALARRRIGYFIEEIRKIAKKSFPDGEQPDASGPTLANPGDTEGTPVPTGEPSSEDTKGLGGIETPQPDRDKLLKVLGLTMCVASIAKATENYPETMAEGAQTVFE
jgi:hypothetical protein